MIIVNLSSIVFVLPLVHCFVRKTEEVPSFVKRSPFLFRNDTDFLVMFFFHSHYIHTNFEIGNGPTWLKIGRIFGEKRGIFLGFLRNADNFCSFYYITSFFLLLFIHVGIFWNGMHFRLTKSPLIELLLCEAKMLKVNFCFNTTQTKALTIAVLLLPMNLLLQML